MLGMAGFMYAQKAEIGITGRGEKATVAIPDFRGAGQAQQFMDTFNKTLWNDIATSGQVKMVSKSFYPTQIPQQPQDLKPAPATPSLAQWNSPPTQANWLAFGYTAVQNGQLVLFGWLDATAAPNPSSAQIIGKIYVGTLDEAGAIKVAHDFAADILKQFGAVSLTGTKIYFVSDRGGAKEIWSMNYDGSDQKQFTHYRSITNFPVISPDNSKVSFMSYTGGTPQIYIYSTETGRKLPFYNQRASMNAPSDFTPDGRRLLLYSTAAGGDSQIYSANIDGSDWKRITNSRALEVEAKINPKTGADIVFVSGRGGLPQIYKMNADGTDVVRLTNGEGEAVNPCWNPDGQHIAFAWTRGFEPGNYNVFIMDVATREVVQLTHGEGRNENPVWAPDGVHIVYSSKRGRSTQIYTMLADGTGQQQLTSIGNNIKPVWSRAASQ